MIFQNDSKNTKDCLHYSNLKDNTMPQENHQKPFKNGARNTNKGIKVFIQGMALNNTKGNAMVRNLKDYSIQPFLDDKRNPTI